MLTDFLVRVTSDNIDIRTGPGIDYEMVCFAPIGLYMISRVEPGQGSKSGWGELLSGEGWITMDGVSRTV